MLSGSGFAKGEGGGIHKSGSIGVRCMKERSVYASSRCERREASMFRFWFCDPIPGQSHFLSVSFIVVS